jgi:site-specific recombinase XerD
MTGHAPYRIYRRRTAKTKSGRPVYKFYYALWDDTARRYGPSRSTAQTTRTAAERWLALHLAQEQESALSLQGFATGLFDEGSEYLVYREQRGRPMSWNHRRHYDTYLKRYILNYLGTRPLAGLGVLDVERFQSWLLKQPARDGKGLLTPSTANHVVMALRSVTKWAIHQRLLRHDPFVGVENLATLPRRRGIFELAEVTRIFSLGPEGWPDPGARLLNALACACGLRKGELQGLRRECVQETTLADGRKAGVLLVDASWERSGRLKGTKSGRSRLAPVPPALYADLSTYLDASCSTLPTLAGRYRTIRLTTISGGPWRPPASARWSARPGT